tara:strand:+ start:298 stop:459 length:162 start_codon:yes stop_codon:yes gene_type:complete
LYYFSFAIYFFADVCGVSIVVSFLSCLGVMISRVQCFLGDVVVFVVGAIIAAG